MKKDLTELVFILDRSGSMAGLESDTVGGYNGMLNKQRKETGDAIVTTVLFDDAYELLHDRIDIKGIANITEKEYYVRGCTALHDAVGKTIAKIKNAQSHTMESQRPEKTLFVIITDGLENSSKEYSSKKVKRMVEDCRKLGWEFIFLGANIDAVETAGTMGIEADRSVNYHSDAQGTAVNFECVSEAVSEVRSGKKLGRAWRKAIDADYNNRND